MAPDPHRPKLPKLPRLEQRLVRGLTRGGEQAGRGSLGVRLTWALFMFVNGFITIGLLAVLAMLLHTPLVFPSLGPTAFLAFFAPERAGSSPRHAMVGHALALLCGWGALWLTGLQHAPSATVEGVTLARAIAAALSLSLTGALMILFRVAHPPAGATTLIVSLGIITAPWHLLTIELAVGLLALQAIVINRLAGLDYPLWDVPPEREDS